MTPSELEAELTQARAEVRELQRTAVALRATLEQAAQATRASLSAERDRGALEFAHLGPRLREFSL